MTSDPRFDLLGLINGFQITQAIRVASILQVADYLNEGSFVGRTSGTDKKPS